MSDFVPDSGGVDGVSDPIPECAAGEITTVLVVDDSEFDRQLVTRLLAGYLLNVSPLDPAAFIGAASVLLAVTIVASYAPARRAARVAPGEVLARDVS